jgi:hypothetical protein
LSIATLAFALLAATRVLYLNFSDGHEAFQLGDDDDAPTNRSAIGAKSDYPAFAPELAAGAREELTRRVVAGVHRAFLPYDLQLATTRPAAGPYTMVVIGGGPGALGFESTVGGVAVLDCKNDNESNIVFVFPQALRLAPAGLITTVAQEAAHSYGLEHSTNQSDFMFPRISPTQERFADEVATIAGAPMCGVTIQNSHEKLLAVLGPWAGGPKTLADGTAVDTEAPRVRFLTPSPDQMMEAPFTVTLDATDDGAVTQVELAAGAQRVVLQGPPWRWTVPAAPDGPLTVSATAHDAWGNESTATLRVQIVEPEASGCVLAPGGRTKRGASWGVLAAAAALLTCRRGRRRL